MRIEDYALIGDLRTTALVGRNGSIDWLCMPQTDSPACFASLLGTDENGSWQISPSEPVRSVSRRYRDGTLILETDFQTDGGRARLIDFMPLRNGDSPQLVRIVEGLDGEVAMQMRFAPRFDYGSLAPWVEPTADGLQALGGANALHLATPTQMRSEDADSALARTDAWWREWSSRCTYTGEWQRDVLRSLITLKALTDLQTGAVVAAPTTSLPEDLGGSRNWDYRYCWLRDAVLTLDALLDGGYVDEAVAFGAWALRAGAGDASKLQIMYGTEGQRHLDEVELDWLAGYEGSRPVRVGNAAAKQFQLDVYGEVAGVAYATAMATGQVDRVRWPQVRELIEYLEQAWSEPDDGIWETRGPRRHFVQSKVMAWLAIDRTIRLAEHFELDAPLARWKRVRTRIHKQVCDKGYDPERKTFTQYYGSKELDSAVLMIPLVGFLPGDDERVSGTLDALMGELGHDGFLSRYSTAQTDDGLSGSEGQFLACSFWLVSALAMNGRTEQARTLFKRLLEIANDLGLYSEEYDVPRKRLVGNFPQAFTHLTLVAAAKALDQAPSPTHAAPPAAAPARRRHSRAR